MERTAANDDERTDLLSTLEVIEAQPLGSRAEAYTGLHDALAQRLDSAPSRTSST